VPSKAAKVVLAALEGIASKMPFPILGVDSDNGSEFINVYIWIVAACRRAGAAGWDVIWSEAVVRVRVWSLDLFDRGGVGW
jgi:hypothetical protein